MSQLGDKRHLIGAMTLKSVDTFFETAQYVDKPKRIIKYASWALEDTGPAWYEVPSPCGYVLGMPGYTVSFFSRDSAGCLPSSL